MVINNLTSEEAAIPAVQRIVMLFEKAFTINHLDLMIKAIIGISIFPKNGRDVSTLLKNADATMYRVKKHGRNNYHFFNDELNKLSLARLELENYLHKAIEADEFVLYYQPLVEMNTGLITGAEALIRWQHPQLGMIQPFDFIPLAEEIGLIIPIGEWVLRTACLQNKAWQKADLPFISVAVNISGVQFKQENFDVLIRNILIETGLAPQYLELELTESSIIDSEEEIIEVLQNIKNMGIKLAIDDFGTGYSSLSYLKRFPIDKLKIDRSFIKDVATDKDDAAIVLAVIAMANSLKLKVLAEGTETESQIGFLRLHHCDEVQGYHFSRPLPAEEFAEFLRKNYKRVIKKEY